MISWLGELVRGVDSSLLDEWERLRNPHRRTGRRGAESDDRRRVTANERAFRVLVRNALFRRVELVALRRYAELGELHARVRLARRRLGRGDGRLLGRVRRPRHRPGRPRPALLIIDTSRDTGRCGRFSTTRRATTTGGSAPMSTWPPPTPTAAPRSGSSRLDSCRWPEVNLAVWRPPRRPAQRSRPVSPDSIRRPTAPHRRSSAPPTRSAAWPVQSTVEPGHPTARHCWDTRPPACQSPMRPPRRRRSRSDGSEQFTPTAMTFGLSAASANASAKGWPARVRSPSTVYDNHAGTPMPSSASSMASASLASGTVSSAITSGPPRPGSASGVGGTVRVRLG